ncbi:MAG: hypothetical protein QXH37_00640 [Candidatus Bathyarchaeia archaeon]
MKAPLLFTLVVVIFSSSLTFLQSTANASDEVFSALGDADNALKRAFEAVLEAERAGADVSDLRVRLNDAGELLAKAENAYRTGNFSEAVSRAVECSILVDGVIDEALNLKSLALTNAWKTFQQTLMFSCVGSAAFLATLFFVWLWFKRTYAEKLMRMKPEVALDVEA